MATAKETQELAKRVDASSLVSSRPAFLKAPDAEGPATYRGQDEISPTDMLIPRVAICQDGSPARKKQSPNYIPGIEPGDLYNTVTLENYGNELIFTPLLFHKSRIKFKPMDQGGGVECMNPTGKACALNNGGPCLYSAWGGDGKPPACDELYNYPSLVLTTKSGGTDFAIISFKRTGIPAAKDLNSKVRMRQADMFAGTYRLTTFIDKNKAGIEYFAPKVDNVGWVDADMYKRAEEHYNGFHEAIMSGRARMDIKDLETEVREGEEPPF